MTTAMAALPAVTGVPASAPPLVPVNARATVRLHAKAKPSTQRGAITTVPVIVTQVVQGHALTQANKNSSIKAARVTMRP